VFVASIDEWQMPRPSPRCKTGQQRDSADTLLATHSLQTRRGEVVEPAQSEENDTPQSTTTSHRGQTSLETGT
jgi:hypothetical protein